MMKTLKSVLAEARQEKGGQRPHKRVRRLREESVGWERKDISKEEKTSEGNRFSVRQEDSPYSSRRDLCTCAKRIKQTRAVTPPQPAAQA